MKTFCPNCYKLDCQKKTALVAKVKESYGKVSEEEYLTMRKEADDFTPSTEQENLTYSSEIFVCNRDGCEKDIIFNASYSAYCDVCGWKFKFHKAEIVE
jgi:hypothetical protein